MLYKTCKFPHQLNILSRFPQKAKLAPIKEKCKSSRGRALNYLHTLILCYNYYTRKFYKWSYFRESFEYQPIKVVQHGTRELFFGNKCPVPTEKMLRLSEKNFARPRSKDEKMGKTLRHFIPKTKTLANIGKKFQKKNNLE